MNANGKRRLSGSLGGVVALALAMLAGCNDNSSPKPTSSEGGTAPTPQWRAAVGAGGTLVQTFDDHAWAARVVPFATGVDLLGVACVGNANGWAVGARGAVAHTTDGGLSWRAEDAHTTATLRAIRFVDARRGLLVGDDGTLDVTGDGGATWRTAATGVTTTLRGVAVAGDAFLAVGDDGTVLRSVDAGGTFATVRVDGAGDLRSVAMDPGGHLALAVDARGVAWSSTDRGATFTREETGSAALAAVALRDDGTVAVAVGARGALVWRDATGGWRSADSGTTADLHAALLEGEAAYLAGDEGTLLVAHEFHANAAWQRISTGTSSALFALDDL
jgi:photosystem II stability/assembly factor-like uncharacterized protein